VIVGLRHKAARAAASPQRSPGSWPSESEQDVWSVRH